MRSLLTSSRIILVSAIAFLLAGSRVHSIEKNSTGLPNVSTRKESGWALSADFLYWRPSEDTSSIWASAISIGQNTSSWDVPSFKFKRAFGFRLGTGYNLAYDQWDTALYWTWFRTEKSHTIRHAPDTFINPEFDAAFLTRNNALSLKGHWSLLFNMFDWELGRSYWVSRCLFLRPFMGIKGGWIHQSIRARYSDLIINDVQTDNSGRERLKNNFWGIGPSAGINTKWKVRDLGFHYLNFFGDFSFATLWGSWACSDVYKNTLAHKFSVKTKNSSLGVPMFRGFVGIGWDANLRANRSHFAAKLGFEMQLWLNQLRIATLQVQRLHGDLTLHGLTFNCRYDY